MASVDVTVRGAGIFGLSTAWACVQRGARVRVVDPYGPGSGSSGGIVGALAPHVPERWEDKKEFQLDSLLMAQQFWSEVEAAGRVSAGYGRTGRLQVLADDRAVGLAQDRAKDAEMLWQGRAIWKVVEVADQGTFAPKSPTGLLVYDTLSGRMFPRHAVAALVAALETCGVDIVPEAKDDGAVIWATGYQGLLDLSEKTGAFFGNGVKGQSVLVKHSAPDAPQIFVDGLHLIPHANGTVAIGSTSERYFEDPTGTDAQCDVLLERAYEALPLLADAEILEKWAGVRPRAKTRAPLLGRWPGERDVFVANGGFKIGFGMAPKVAQVMADLVLNDIDQIPDDFRLKPVS